MRLAYDHALSWLGFSVSSCGQLPLRPVQRKLAWGGPSVAGGGCARSSLRWYLRGPAMMFRARTELTRVFLGLAHVLLSYQGAIALRAFGRLRDTD